MSYDVGEVTEKLENEPVTKVKRKKGWRMSCDVGEATERLEIEFDVGKATDGLENEL